MGDEVEDSGKTALRGSGDRPSSLRTWSVVVCAVLAVIAVVADSPFESPPYLGYRWEVESITRGGTTTPVPSSLGASATFHEDGRMLLTDTVNALTSHIDLRSDGFSARPAGTTLALYVGDDAVRKLVIATMADLSSAERATVSVAGAQLAIDTGEYRLALVRGAEAGGGAPSSAPGQR
ncbi:MAG: hypothetical protein ABIQ18_33550 [Umezawaea sp.]